jgi:hypothetical protein
MNNPRLDLPRFLQNSDWKEATHLITLFEGSARMFSPQGDLPLHLACRLGAPTELMNLIMNSYEEATTLPSKATTRYALSDALCQEPGFYDLDIMLKLVNSNACCDASKSALGESCLIQSISKKYPLRAIDLILNSNLNALKIEDEMGDLPLHIAVKQGSPMEVIKLLYTGYTEAATIKDQDDKIILKGGGHGLW